MNREANVIERRVRFDSSADRLEPENKPVNMMSSEDEKQDREMDEAIAISKKILELSRQRRRNTRMILLEVAQNQGNAMTSPYQLEGTNNYYPQKTVSAS